MKKQGFLIAIAILLLNVATAQDFQGKAHYRAKTSAPEFKGRKDMPEARRKQIMERIKKMSENTFVLTFDKAAATYIKEEKLEAPGEGGGRMLRFGSMGDGKLYKNIADQSFVEESEMFGKIFLIKDKLPTYSWVMGSETKKIGNYTCYKATAVIPKDTTSFESLMQNRRKERELERKKESGEEEVKKEENTSIFAAAPEKKETVITAWFTPEIPVSNGPGDFWGLPGLILEVNTGKTVILCTKIVLNADEKVKIAAPKKGKEISQKEYDALMLQKMDEMRDRFRGGNRRGGGGRPH